MSIKIAIPKEQIAAFCRKHYIRKLSLFGSVLRNDFTRESDVDVLVEFEPNHVPGLAFFAIQDELGKILECQVDMHTPAGLSPYLRWRILEKAEVLHDGT